MAASLALALVPVPIRWRIIEDTAETSSGLNVHAQGYTPVHTRAHIHTPQIESPGESIGLDHRTRQ